MPLKRRVQVQRGVGLRASLMLRPFAVPSFRTCTPSLQYKGTANDRNGGILRCTGASLAPQGPLLSGGATRVKGGAYSVLKGTA
jgi:hypothetical protein